MGNSSTDSRVSQLHSSLRDGCSGCLFDEAEGGIVDHCNECRETIATLAYALLITHGWHLVSEAEMTQLITERDAARLIAKKRLELLIAEGVV